MVKSALCISEIMIQNSKPEIALNEITINIIENQRNYINSVYQQINDLGKQKLSSGLRSLNQPNISIGLQVFHNLVIDKLNNIRLPFQFLESDIQHERIIFQQWNQVNRYPNADQSKQSLSNHHNI